MICGVLSHMVDEVWPQVESFLQSAVDKSDGTYDLKYVKQECKARNMQLWIYLDGDILAAAVTQIQMYPSKKVLTLLFCGGERMDEWMGNLDIIEDFARDKECESLMIYGRKGWAKMLPDYEQIQVVLRKDL